MTIAMVFPGQGSQSVGMQAELADVYAGVREVYNEASERLNYDLWALVQEGTAERLGETVVTQPAMLTAGIASWKCWQAAGGPKPEWLAGHSLGEYTALVVAGSVTFSDAIDLVRTRAELMQQAVPAGRGAMAAILGLDDATVAGVCEAASQGEVVSPVNYNAPGQVVIAGAAPAVERATEGAKEAGARRAIMLNVSVPSHCALMAPAAEALAETMASVEFAAPEIPVISNVDVNAYASADDVRDGLKRQVFNPVRWVETVRHLVSQEPDCIIECGPGKVLAGLSKRIDRSVPSFCIDTPDALSKAIG